MASEIRDYPFDVRHPAATAGILPTETREILIGAGWVHESEVDAMSCTKFDGRRRWGLPHAMIGNERYYRLSDILARLETNYLEHAKSLAEKRLDDRRARSAIA